jgi:MFS family permease
LKLWASQSVSLAGNQLGSIALPLVAILTLHASPAQVGLLAGLGSAPWLVAGLLVGVVIDRMRRRPVLIAAHLGRAAALASVPSAAILGVLTMPQLYVVVVVNGVFGMCFEAAYHSYLPTLIPADALAAGNSRLAITDGIARTAGPSLGGLAVQVLTAPLTLGFQVLTYAGAGLAIWRIRTHEPSPEPDGTTAGLVTGLRRGISFIWRHPLVRILAGSEATYLFFFEVTFTTMLVFYARNLHLTPSEIGIIYAAGSIGGIVGGLAAGSAGRTLRPGPTMAAGSLLRSLGLAIVPLAVLTPVPAVVFPVVARFLNSFGWTLWEVHQMTTQQLATPNALRGRVTSTILFLAHGAETVGGFTGACLVAVLGVMPTLVTGGLGALLAFACLAALPKGTGNPSTPAHRRTAYTDGS